MPVLIRFNINAPSISPPTYEQIAKAIGDQGRSDGNEPAEFTVWGHSQYKDATVVEYHANVNFATALSRVKAAVQAAGVEQWCQNGDLRIEWAY